MGEGGWASARRVSRFSNTGPGRAPSGRKPAAGGCCWGPSVSLGQLSPFLGDRTVTQSSHRHQRGWVHGLGAADWPAPLHATQMQVWRKVQPRGSWGGGTQVGRASRGQPILHAQLGLEDPQLGQADVAATADDDHQGGQGDGQLPLPLQLPHHVTVDRGQRRPAGGLHQRLLVVCGARGVARNGEAIGRARASPANQVSALASLDSWTKPPSITVDPAFPAWVSSRGFARVQ